MRYTILFTSLLLVNACRTAPIDSDSTVAGAGSTGVKISIKLSGMALKNAVDLASMAKFNADSAKTQPFVFKGIVRCIEEQSHSPDEPYFFTQSCRISENANSSIFEMTDQLAKPIIDALRQVARRDGNPRIWSGKIDAALRNSGAEAERSAIVHLD